MEKCAGESPGGHAHGVVGDEALASQGVEGRGGGLVVAVESEVVAAKGVDGDEDDTAAVGQPGEIEEQRVGHGEGRAGGDGTRLAAAAAQGQLELQQPASAGAVELDGRVAEAPLGPKVDPALSHLLAVRADGQVQEAVRLARRPGPGRRARRRAGPSSASARGSAQRRAGPAAPRRRPRPRRSVGDAPSGVIWSRRWGPWGRDFPRARRRRSDERQEEDDAGKTSPERGHRAILREAPR